MDNMPNLIDTLTEFRDYDILSLTKLWSILKEITFAAFNVSCNDSHLYTLSVTMYASYCHDAALLPSFIS